MNLEFFCYYDESAQPEPEPIDLGDSLYCDGPACALYYHDIGGTAVSELTGNANFPENPADIHTLTEGNFETEDGYGDNYGAMLEGWFQAPETGTYTFITYSDDASEIWIVPEAGVRSWDALVKVVELTGCCQTVHGDVEVSLVAGESYYLVGLVNEGGGGDYLLVGTHTPSGQELMPIPLSYFVAPATADPCGTDSESALESLYCDAGACALYYYDVGGTAVSELTGNANFPENPGVIHTLTEGNFETE